jgi:hypothetical protein
MAQAEQHQRIVSTENNSDLQVIEMIGESVDGQAVTVHPTGNRPRAPANKRRFVPRHRGAFWPRIARRIVERDLAGALAPSRLLRRRTALRGSPTGRTTSSVSPDDPASTFSRQAPSTARREDQLQGIRAPDEVLR